MFAGHKALYKLIAGILVLTSITACDVPYYWQAAKGHYDLMQARRPVADIINDSNTTTQLTSTLKDILAARAFALSLLELEDNQSYLTYVELDRPYVTWNVFATPELSMENHTWCYPIAGCVSYRGYFAKEKAQAKAQILAKEGMDTFVGGASAYSTLGWFDDPILSTFISSNPLANAALLFHELAHQTLYVKDDSQFNESYATAIEQILLQRWVQQNNLQSQWLTYQQAKDRNNAFMALIIANKEARQEVYQADLPMAEKRRLKHLLIEELNQQYQQFKKDWDNYSGFDSWMEKGVNNAQISTIATYYQWVPAIHNRYQQLNQRVTTLIEECQELASLDTDNRTKVLNQWASEKFDYTQ